MYGFGVGLIMSNVTHYNVTFCPFMHAWLRMIVLHPGCYRA